MLDEQVPCMAQLELLMNQLSSDLAAIALLDHYNKIKWRYMLGNMNDRYRRMITKPGSGLAGRIIRYGRTVIIDQAHPNTAYLNEQSPLMLSEQLISVITMPLTVDYRICGALLIGDRQERVYSYQDIRYVDEAKERIATIMPKEFTRIGK